MWSLRPARSAPADLGDDHSAEDRADAGQGLDGVIAVMAVKQSGPATFS
jgi:hypothetical protein